MKIGKSLIAPLALVFLVFPRVAICQSIEPQAMVIDDAVIFTDRVEEKEALEKHLSEISLQTNSALILKTISLDPGITANALANQILSTELGPDIPGAVIVFIRSSRKFGVATTAATSDIPTYMFTSIENPGYRASDDPVMMVTRSTRELASVFRKQYGPELEKNPAEKGDMILMIVMAGIIAALVFLFAFVSWRQQTKEAAAANS